MPPTFPHKDTFSFYETLHYILPFRGEFRPEMIYWMEVRHAKSWVNLGTSMRVVHRNAIIVTYSKYKFVKSSINGKHKNRARYRGRNTKTQKKSMKQCRILQSLCLGCIRDQHSGLLWNNSITERGPTPTQPPHLRNIIDGLEIHFPNQVHRTRLDRLSQSGQNGSWN